AAHLFMGGEFSPGTGSGFGRGRPRTAGRQSLCRQHGRGDCRRGGVQRLPDRVARDAAGRTTAAELNCSQRASDVVGAAESAKAKVPSPKSQVSSPKSTIHGPQFRARKVERGGGGGADRGTRSGRA